MSPLERFRQLRTLRNVAPSARLILYALTSHADKDGDLWISQHLLHLETGLADRTLRTWLRWLSKKGLIIEQRHGHHASSFRLTVSAFIELASKSAESAERIRPYRPTEVAPMKKRPKTHKPKPAQAMQCAHCRQTTHHLNDAHLCRMCADLTPEQLGAVLPFAKVAR